MQKDPSLTGKDLFLNGAHFVEKTETEEITIQAVVIQAQIMIDFCAHAEYNQLVKQSE